MEKIDRAEISRFLGYLFGREGLLDRYSMVLWTSPGRVTRFFRRVEDAAAWAERQAANENVYFGVGLHATIPAKGRGTAKDVDAITALWADVDFAGDPAEGHTKKTGTAASEAKALSIVRESLGLEPSIIVHSGHGMQAYWLFEEPILLATDEDRARAQALERRLLDALRKRSGCAIDAVHDFARVMRLPGTANRKGKTPVEARILEPAQGAAPRFYRREELEAIIGADAVPAPALPQTAAPIAKVAPVARLDPGVLRKIELLCQNDPRFKRTWERKRSDFADQSASSYDLSVASQMAIAGATDSEIAGAILAWRAKHGEDSGKAARADYMARTLARARAAGARAEALRATLDAAGVSIMSDGAPAPDDSGPPTDPQEVRRRILENASRTLGIPIKRFVKHGRENSIYSIELADGTDVVLGTASRLLTQSAVRARIMDATNIAIREIKAQNWIAFVNALLRAVEELENEEATREAQIRGWLREFLADKTAIITGENWTAALPAGLPFVKGDLIYISVPAFLRAMRFDLPAEIKRADIWDMLRVIGFSAATVTASVEGSKICRYYWRGPVAAFEDIVQAAQRSATPNGVSNGEMDVRVRERE